MTSARMVKNRVLKMWQVQSGGIGQCQPRVTNTFNLKTRNNLPR